MIRVYDDRIPSHEALVMLLNNLKGSEVKGIDLFTHNGRTVLAAADKDGRLVVYEPRMYQVCIQKDRYLMFYRFIALTMKSHHFFHESMHFRSPFSARPLCVRTRCPQTISSTSSRCTPADRFVASVNFCSTICSCI